MGGGRRMRLVLGLLGVEYYSLRCLWWSSIWCLLYAWKAGELLGKFVGLWLDPAGFICCFFIFIAYTQKVSVVCGVWREGCWIPRISSAFHQLRLPFFPLLLWLYLSRNLYIKGGFCTYSSPCTCTMYILKLTDSFGFFSSRGHEVNWLYPEDN